MRRTHIDHFHFWKYCFRTYSKIAKYESKIRYSTPIVGRYEWHTALSLQPYRADRSWAPRTVEWSQRLSSAVCTRERGACNSSKSKGMMREWLMWCNFAQLYISPHINFICMDSNWLHVSIPLIKLISVISY